MTVLTCKCDRCGTEGKQDEFSSMDMGPGIDYCKKCVLIIELERTHTSIENLLDKQTNLSAEMGRVVARQKELKGWLYELGVTEI